MAKERVGERLRSYFTKLYLPRIYFPRRPKAVEALAGLGPGGVVALFGPDKNSVNRTLRLMEADPLTQEEIDQIEKDIQENLLRREKRERAPHPPEVARRLQPVAMPE